MSCALRLPVQLTLEALEQRLVPALPRPDHVVIAIEENHSYSQIIGSSSAPYINSLANEGALMTNSSGVTHPSEPNYLDLFSGSNQGVANDSCPHTFSAVNLGQELVAAHDSFGGYSETLPSVGYTGCSAGGQHGYVRRHNPWVDFTNVPTADNMPFQGYFPSDFTKLPLVSFVVPNLNDDMHDGTVKAGDQWLQAHLQSYVQWAMTHDSVFILTFDEGDDQGSQGNHIVTIFDGEPVNAGHYSETINHYNVLRTVEDMYGLPHAGNSASAKAITDIWNNMQSPIGDVLLEGNKMLGGGGATSAASPRAADALFVFPGIAADQGQVGSRVANSAKAPVRASGALEHQVSASVSALPSAGDWLDVRHWGLG
jgi:hypothetical protein